ncbi:MAG: alpha/beta hydrolase [Acidimicrobiales bacterium]|nr:alpha/beta hydrolase [Acidimicrobiales bacterium]
MILLHGEDGLLFCGPFLERLGPDLTVEAPVHPGWRGAPHPAHVTTIGDLAYHYLDLLEARDGPVHLVGLSFGGWLAAEIAVRNPSVVASLVLVSPLGIKVGPRDHRDHIDLYALAPEAAHAAGYSSAAAAPDLAQLDDDGFLTLAVAQEAVTRFAWQPYLHNPKLVHRLHRIAAPTVVVCGAADALVAVPGYYERFVDAIGANARLVTVDGVGHRIEEEAPDELAALVTEHVHAATFEGGR